MRSELKTRTKAAVTAAEAGADDADAKLRLAIKRIDKAAAKGVIHRNAAARRKSRLVARQCAAEPSGPGTTARSGRASTALIAPRGHCAAAGG